MVQGFCELCSIERDSGAFFCAKRHLCSQIIYLIAVSGLAKLPPTLNMLKLF